MTTTNETPLWAPTDSATLANGIARFEAELPGWWWSLGACSVSRDVSCGPDRQGPEGWMLRHPLLQEPLCFDFDCGLVEGIKHVISEASDIRERVLADEEGSAAAKAAWAAERQEDGS